MTLIVFFIFGAVVLGAGAMLSPAYPTSQPRIGLNASLALALIAGGAVFYGTAAGWNTLVVDYMLFLLVTSIFLGGTLSFGQKRAEARGEELADADQGWPGPYDLLGLGAALTVFIVVALAQAGSGVAAAHLTFDAQAVNAGTESLYVTSAPAHTALTAYLSGQLSAPLGEVGWGLIAVLGGVFVWIAYDLGAELRDKSLGRVLAAIAFVPALITVFATDGAILLGMTFTLAFVTYSVRYLRGSSRADLVVAGLMLGAVILTVPAAVWVALACAIAATALIARQNGPARAALYALVTVIVAAAATAPTLIQHGLPIL
ncbi:MAG: hypothetical protein IPM16_16650 [Chloroflexi bacterium]|nr:hypothetical protein [Chloroflexota bacterium]